MKKLDIGAAKAAPPKKNGSHPDVEVGERLAALLKQFIVVNPQYKRFKSEHETLSRDIGAETRVLYFDHFAGIVPQSATMLAHIEGHEIKLIVKDQYSQSLDNDEPLVAAIGRANVDKYFHWRTKYGVDYDKIPEALQEPFAHAIEEARERLGVPAEAVTAKQFIEPNAGFHDSRTMLLTPEENKRLDSVLAVRSMPILAS